MSNKIELENEELLKGMMSTFDDMFARMFTRSVCEAEVSDLDEEDDDDDKDQ